MTSAPHVRSHSTAGIAETTGMAWEDWVKLLDQAGAEKLTHTQIAALSRENMPAHVVNSGWWAQGVAIAYEHQKGLRTPGQTSDGRFSASASKTFSGDKDAAFARWLEVVASAEQFGEVPLAAEPSTSATEKWRYWRAALADGTRVSVTVSDKPGGKSVVAVQHAKLASQEMIGYWKSVWKDVLSQLPKPPG